MVEDWNSDPKKDDAPEAAVLDRNDHKAVADTRYARLAAKGVVKKDNGSSEKKALQLPRPGGN